VFSTSRWSLREQEGGGRRREEEEEEEEVVSEAEESQPRDGALRWAGRAAQLSSSVTEVLTGYDGTPRGSY